MRIACPNFTPEEVDALRSLLGLLRPYLKTDWRVVSGCADVYFVNLDTEPCELPDTAGSLVVGCALRPREHRKNTIHRPLRTSAVLAVLSQFAEDSSAAPVRATRAQGVEWSYRLRAWPLEFCEWPREWGRILATIARQPRTLSEIATRTDLAQAEVERCIAVLTRLDLVDRVAERNAPVAAMGRPAGWRGLARRVGQVLGFRR